MWRDKPVADQTLDNFKAHFNFENKERHCKLTAKSAGFHGTHQAALIPQSPAAASAAVPGAPRPAISPAIPVDNNIQKRCCQIHVLGKTPARTTLVMENRAKAVFLGERPPCATFYLCPLHCTQGGGTGTNVQALGNMFLFFSFFSPF
jgi:hypothetical protein